MFGLFVHGPVVGDAPPEHKAGPRHGPRRKPILAPDGPVGGSGSARSLKRHTGVWATMVSGRAGIYDENRPCAVDDRASPLCSRPRLC